MEKRRICKVCKARRYEKEMTPIHDDVYVCDSKFWRWSGYDSSSRGGCSSNKKLMKQLTTIYKAIGKVDDFDIKLQIKPIPKSLIS